MTKRVVPDFLILVFFVSLTSGPYVTAGATDEVKERVARECSARENIFDRIVCFGGRAVEQGDFRICDLSSHEGVRFQCYAVFAERVKDQNICFEIPLKSAEHRGLRDACLGDVAEALIDPGICGTIETPGLRDSCYLKIFSKTGDLSLCEKIEDPGLKSGCTKEPVYVK